MNGRIFSLDLDMVTQIKFYFIFLFNNVLTKMKNQDSPE